jgi:hypothetical protein
MFVRFHHHVWLALSIVCLLGCAESTAPQIANVTILDNTFSSVGPYIVTANIVDEGRIIRAALIYRVNGSEFLGVEMTAINNTTFQAEIPGYPVGSRIQYEVAAADNDGEISRIPEDAEMFVFEVLERP